MSVVRCFVLLLATWNLCSPLSHAQPASTEPALSLSKGSGQAYPQKPVRIIVPYPPGGATDLFARLLAAKLSETFGQQFIAEQHPGAAGVIGAELAARAAPDGYTLWVGQASNLAINQHLMKKLPYDPVKDFTPITLMTTSPNLLVVHLSLPVRSIKDLITLAKAKPGAINYASSGNGSPGHLAAEYFKTVAKVNMVHIPYKGAGPALLDVIAGQAQLYQFAVFIRSEIANWGRIVAASGARID